MKNRLELKILLLIILALISGFGTYVIISINRESAMLLEEQRQKSTLFSETVMVGIRSVMLSGKIPLAVELVKDARKNLPFGALRMYDRRAVEVFTDEEHETIYGAGDSTIRRIIQTRKGMVTAGKDFSLLYAQPLLNETACQRCHGSNHSVRGVLQLSLAPQLFLQHEKAQYEKNVIALAGKSIAVAFRNIMVAEKAPLMDTLIHRLNRMPFIEQTAVYNDSGEIRFGKSSKKLQRDSLLALFHSGQTSLFYHKEKKSVTQYIPLPNEQRCRTCHGSDKQQLGIMEITLKTESVKNLEKNPAEEAAAIIQQIVAEGFRSIMLTEKGIYIRYFINEIRSSGIVDELHIYDRFLNERFANIQIHPDDSQFAFEAIQKDSVIEIRKRENNEEFLSQFIPLRNDSRCQPCHGTDHTIRGVIGISGSMEEINNAISRNRLYSGIAGAATIFLVWLVLRIFMKLVVVKPINVIGEAAMEVGRGNFSAAADVHSNDEIGDLAKRFNAMIQGLRERFHLEKFVSRQTVDFIKKADERGVKLGGERKKATVFFSDVRGFTAYTEKVEPEHVVKLLNALFSRQAEIVKKYGGDIDKYVGDELVAVFQCDNMVEKAVRCAVEIQQAMKNLHAELGEEISIGIGINTGEMVMGAMGSEERMDFTVIGDVVNLGARLCSAAERGQVLISEQTAEYLFNNSFFHLTKLEPMKVKGKESFIQVYEVHERKK